MRNKVLATVMEFAMIGDGELVIAAVSGGADSVALLHVLADLSPSLGCRLMVAHINHGLRGTASDGDARFVVELADRMGLRHTAAHIDVAALARERGMSLEESGRLARYEYLSELAVRYGAKAVATGHHRDDQAETVLMNILRGTGLPGLAGLPPVRLLRGTDGAGGGACLIRPLHRVTKDELLAYCRDHGLEYREDATNRDPAFTRNKIRLELLPLLEQGYNRSIKTALWQLGELVRDELKPLTAETACLADRLIKERGPHLLAVDLEALNSLSRAGGRRLIREVVSRLSAGLKALDFHHVEEILDLARKGRPGAALHLPGQVRARRQYGELVFFLAGRHGRAARFRYRLPVPGYCRVPEAGLEIQAAVLEPATAGEVQALISQARRLADQGWFDYNEVGRCAGRHAGVLEVRNRMPGDRFRPFGMPGSKKVKDYFIEMHVPREQRDSIPLVAAGEHILWVAGYRVAHDFRVRPESRRILVLSAGRVAGNPEI